MARPRSTSDEDVLNAAGRVLLSKGPSAFTLADVAAECALAPPTLVQRFGSKRGLLVAFARQCAERAEHPFQVAATHDRGPLQTVRDALAISTKDLRTRQQVAASIAMLLADLNDPELGEAAARHATTTRSAIKQLLDAAVEAGQLPPTDTEALAVCVQSAFNGALVQWALCGSGRLQTFVSRVLDPLLQGGPRARQRTRSPKTKSASKANR